MQSTYWQICCSKAVASKRPYSRTSHFFLMLRGYSAFELSLEVEVPGRNGCWSVHRVIKLSGGQRSPVAQRQY